MAIMTEQLTISLSSASWLMGRLFEYRMDLDLPELDRDVPFLVAMPLGTDGVLVDTEIGFYTLANMHAGPKLDLPVDDGRPSGSMSVGSPIIRCDSRRIVTIADCHDTAALFVEASQSMNADNRISDDTHACNIDAAARFTRPYAEVFADAA